MFKIFQELKTIEWFMSQIDNIDFSPAYQRLGNIWSKPQKQLLIDSIFNGFDIPKLYIQYMPISNNKDSLFVYGIIDGKQRLETIKEFIEDKFSVADDFKFIDDNSQSYYISIAGKKFSEIENSEPILASKFLKYELSIVFMDTDEPENITETFVRLNSGVTVNTAEKRNAYGGKLSEEIKKLCETSLFFTNKVRLSNTRYTHLDLALKLLMLEMGYQDLSKKSVDNFVKDNKKYDVKCQQALINLKKKLHDIEICFNDKDTLLSIKNLIITFYSILDEVPVQHLRNFLEYFESWRQKNKSADNVGENEHIDVRMVDFSRNLQQGADKKASLETRKKIMRIYLKEYLEAI